MGGSVNKFWQNFEHEIILPNAISSTDIFFIPLMIKLQHGKRDGTFFLQSLPK